MMVAFQMPIAELCHFGIQVCMARAAIASAFTPDTVIVAVKSVRVGWSDLLGKTMARYAIIAVCLYSYLLVFSTGTALILAHWHSLATEPTIGFQRLRLHPHLRKFSGINPLTSDHKGVRAK